MGYGRKVVIKGLDRCAAFREAVPPADRFVSAAGMFNTGTHVIFNYLDKYCEIPDKEFESMLHMYNQWYQEWEEVAFPRLIVRYEDLLLHPEEVVDKVCSCAGGSWKEKFTLSSEKAKKNGDGLEGAQARYGNATKRTEGYTDADLKFAEKTIDQTMFNTYHYLLP